MSKRNRKTKPVLNQHIRMQSRVTDRIKDANSTAFSVSQIQFGN